MGATAIHIKTESGDNFHFIFKGCLTDDQALNKAELECPEYREHWQDWSVVSIA